MLFVDDVIAGLLERLAIFGLGVALRLGARLQAGDDAVDFVVEIGRRLCRPGNDEGGSRFVDQDAVDFVDDREVVPTLDVLRQLELHVVAEVVEPEFVVGPVGDVGGIRLLPLGVVQVVLDHADAHSEKTVNASHPFGVAPGEVVVHRDDMDPLALERVQVGRQRRNQRLALAGFHFRDGALMQKGAAD